MSYMGPGTASLSNIAGTNSSTQIFPAASHSSGRAVYNDSTAVLYLAFGTLTAAAGTCTTVVGTASTFFFPIPVYAGAVQGVWASSAGTARTTWW